MMTTNAHFRKLLTPREWKAYSEDDAERFEKVRRRYPFQVPYEIGLELSSISRDLWKRYYYRQDLSVSDAILELLCPL